MRIAASMLISLAFLAQGALAQGGEASGGEEATGESAQRYHIGARVWSDGALRGEPELVLTAGKPGRFEVRSPESHWRISVNVEPPGSHENADANALWFKVGIEQRVEGEWIFLTDTMLGTPLGKPGRISVVENGSEASDSEPDPETASLYVELTARRFETR